MQQQRNYADLAMSVPQSSIPDFVLNRFESEPETFEHTVGDKTVKIPLMMGDVNMKDFLAKATGAAAGAARKEAETKLKEKYGSLETALADKSLTAAQLQEKIDAFEMEKLSAEEKVKKQFDNEIKKRDTELSKEKLRADTLSQKYHQKRIESDIREALSGFNLFNQEQTMLMMMHVGKPTFIESEDSEKTVFKMKVDGSEVEMTPKEFAEKFLALPEYANQIKNNLIAGGGTSSGSGSRGTNGKLVFKRSDMRKSPEVRAAYDKAHAANPDSVELIDDLGK